MHVYHSWHKTQSAYNYNTGSSPLELSSSVASPAEKVLEASSRQHTCELVLLWLSPFPCWPQNTGPVGQHSQQSCHWLCWDQWCCVQSHLLGAHWQRAEWRCSQDKQWWPVSLVGRALLAVSQSSHEEHALKQSLQKDGRCRHVISNTSFNCAGQSYRRSGGGGQSCPADCWWSQCGPGPAPTWTGEELVERMTIVTAKHT